MSAGPILQTARLTLRRWSTADSAAFHALNSDPLVMATIGAVMTQGEPDAFMDRIELGFAEHWFGLWCVEFEGEAVGFTGFGIHRVRDSLVSGFPGFEKGWRLVGGFDQTSGEGAWGQRLPSNAYAAASMNWISPR